LDRLVDLLDLFLRTGTKLVLALLILFPVLPSVLLPWFQSGPTPPAFLGPVFSALLMSVSRLDSGAQLGVGPFLIRGGGLLLIAMYCMRPIVHVFRRPSWFWPMVGFHALSLVSAVTCSHPHDALLSWSDSLILTGVVLVISQDQWEFPVKGLALALLAACLFTIPSDIYQFFTSDALDGQMRGSFFHPTMMATYLLLHLPLALLFVLQDPDEGKPSGLVRLRGYLAGLAALCLLFCIVAGLSRAVYIVMSAQIAFWLAWQPALMRPDFRIHPRWGRRGFFALLGWLIWMVVMRVSLAYSQPAIGLVLGMLLGLGWLCAVYPHPIRTGLLLLFIVCLPVGLLALPHSNNPQSTAPVSAKAERLTSDHDSSVSARVVFWKAAWQMSLNHPWLGVGPNGFHRYYPEYQMEERWFSKFAHNQLLATVAENGFPATVLVLVAFLMLTRDALRRIERDLDPLSAQLRLAFLLGAISVGFCSLSDVQWQFPVLPMLSAVGLGVALSDEPLEEVEQAGESAWSMRPAVLLQHGLGATCFACFCINAIWSQSELFFQVSQIAAQRGQVDNAAYFARRACQLDPWQGENFRTLGLNLFSRVGALTPKQKEEMLECARRTVSLDAHRAVSYDLLSKALGVTGDYPKALDAARGALECDPINYPAFYDQVAFCLNRLGRLEEARLVLEACVQRFPLGANADMFEFRSRSVNDGLAPIYVQLGEIANPLVKPADAQHYYSVALKIQPANFQANVGLGVALYMQRKFDASLESLEKARKLNPNFANLYRLESQVYRAMGKGAEAKKADRSFASAQKAAKAQPVKPVPAHEAAGVGSSAVLDRLGGASNSTEVHSP
jgi:tetratricopeptide (TPR) repeat protein